MKKLIIVTMLITMFLSGSNSIYTKPNAQITAEYCLLTSTLGFIGCVGYYLNAHREMRLGNLGLSFAHQQKQSDAAFRAAKQSDASDNTAFNNIDGVIQEKRKMMSSAKVGMFIFGSLAVGSSLYLQSDEIFKTFTV